MIFECTDRSVLEPLLNSLPNEHSLDLRDRKNALVKELSPHEAWVLMDRGFVSGIIRKGVIAYLRVAEGRSARAAVAVVNRAFRQRIALSECNFTWVRSEGLKTTFEPHMARCMAWGRAA